jgi:diguanylate cyclase (GGDEF)-like protein
MRRARVLAVDDQRYFRSFLEELLREEGYEVQTASDGNEALRLFESANFDIVLTDLVMPGLDGPGLVRALRERVPDQDVVVITSVGEVRAAVDAMKQGATDYLMKPIDRGALTKTLDAIVERRRLRDEHGRLIAENLEYWDALSLYERALGLFSRLRVEPLAERVLECLCLDTGAQGGALWLASEDPERLQLAAASGLVRVAEEPEELAVAEALATARRAASEGTADVLHVALRLGERCLGLARLQDRAGGAQFGDRERVVASKLASIAARAVANALEFAALERRSLRDPTTKAYTRAYFDDVVRNEVQKASRFGRRFSMLRLRLEPLAPLRRQLRDTELGGWLEAVVEQVARALRATDLIAAESESTYCLLLPETDALGAAVLKRRIRESLEESEVFGALDRMARPRVLLGTASYPDDGVQQDALDQQLDRRIEEDRNSLVHALELEAQPFPAVVEALMERAQPSPRRVAEQVTRFLFSEIRRRPLEPGVLFVSPGADFASVASAGLATLRGASLRTEIVWLGGERPEEALGAHVTCLPPERAGTRAPFVVYYGPGSAFALVCEEAAGAGPAACFQTSDRALVEHLAFQLQRDLGVSLAASS